MLWTGLDSGVFFCVIRMLSLVESHSVWVAACKVGETISYRTEVDNHKLGGKYKDTIDIQLHHT
jgi:hypothetical protein